MEWFQKWFQEDYDALYHHRNDEQAHRQVDNILKHIPITSHFKILDVGCGKGRHLKYLSQNYDVYGLDLSFYLLNQFKSKDVNNQYKVCQADMRSIPFKRERFDLLCSFFTSLGYFETKEVNLDVLDQFMQLVKPGGYLYLDLMNKEHVVSSLPLKDTREVQGKRVTQDRYYLNDFVCKDITIEFNGETKHFQEKVMPLAEKDLHSVFDRYNAKAIHRFGTEEGGPYDAASSPRCSLLVHKEK